MSGYEMPEVPVCERCGFRHVTRGLCMEQPKEGSEAAEAVGFDEGYAAGRADCAKDARALDELAAILRRPTWPSGADFLGWCADIVRGTGRDIVNGEDDEGVMRGGES